MLTGLGGHLGDTYPRLQPIKNNVKSSTSTILRKKLRTVNSLSKFFLNGS